MKILLNTAAVALSAGVVVNACGQAQQTHCPQDKRSVEAATRFYVSIGTVTMPVGAFLLVRNGTRVVVRPIARLAALRDLQGAQECAGQSLCAALEAWMCRKEWRGSRQNMGSLVERARRWGVSRAMGARWAVEETDRILDGGRTC